MAHDVRQNNAQVRLVIKTLLHSADRVVRSILARHEERVQVPDHVVERIDGIESAPIDRLVLQFAHRAVVNVLVVANELVVNYQDAVVEGGRVIDHIGSIDEALSEIEHSIGGQEGVKTCIRACDGRWLSLLLI